MKGVRKDVSLPLQPLVQEESSFKERNCSEHSLLKQARPSRPKVTFCLVVTVAAAVIGSSPQFGYNTGVLNSPQQAIIDSFGQNVTGPISAQFSSLEMNVAVSIFPIGGMLGALPAGALGDIVGRKYTLILNNVIIFLGVGLESLAVHPAMFIMGRFIVGVGAGIESVLVPIYVTEVAPIQLRGAAGVTPEIAVTGTILLSQLLGISKALGQPDKDFFSWRILLAIPLLFSTFQLLVLPWCPQSPRFLFLKKKDQKATIRALVRLRGSSANIRAEKKEMEEELEEQDKQETMRLSQFLFAPSLRRAMFISIILLLSRHLSGINGILYYSTMMFQLAGVSSADVVTVSVGVVLVSCVVVSVFLVEVVGRRTLMLYGLGGMTIFFSLLTSMFCLQDGLFGNNSSTVTAPGVLLVIFSLGIVILFAIGPAGIPWMMVTELFLQEARPVAVTIGTAANWFANFTVALAFPYILEYLYPYGTLVFVGTCFMLCLFLFLYLPETKGRSVVEITAEFRRKTERVKS